jgi:hypothetical protein
MLSSDIPATPRPRPPAAHNRRSASMQIELFPPPPYAASSHSSRPKSTPLGTVSSSTSAPDVRSHNPRSLSEADDSSWMKEKSREELSELLTKADGIIRERERGEFLVITPMLNDV